ncbi:MAG: hypothetical protein QY304_03670 [Candidatus Paceibacterota bacterium]|nr:MAG: hypothetical protein QY304_03670 [Candidatus Paceibacterota bacterium]
MKTHNFLIATTRPELIVRQVNAFIKVRNGRQINFYIFDDSYDKKEYFLREISKLPKDEAWVKVFYFSLDQQKAMLLDTARKYSLKLHVSGEEILKCFEEKNELRGIRSIQNKSILIFYLKNNQNNSIIHKIDDDILPYEADRRNGRVEIIPKYDFFQHKENVIGHDKKVICGSNYTIDSPSPLVHYADFAEFVYKFLTIAKTKTESELVGENTVTISPSQAEEVLDIHNIVKLLPIGKNHTFGSALRELENHINFFNKGISRVVINDNRLQEKGTNKFFPGGCVSFLYNNVPTLTPLFGNQDLLWELFEALDGKTIFTDGCIGHVKSESNRSSILEDLKDSSYKHQTSVTYAVFSHLVSKNRDGSLHDFEKNFVHLMNKWLEEARDYTKDILRILNHEDGLWFRSVQYRNVLNNLKVILNEFEKSYEEIKSNFSYSNIDADRIVTDYFQKKGIFDKLLKQIISEHV